MSGLSEIGELPGFAFGLAQVQQKDIDQYVDYIVMNPSVSATYMAAATATSGGNTAFVVTSATPDYPRNFLYQVTGGTVGGTFTINGYDQFGQKFTETVTVGTAAAGGSASGTQIFGSITSGTFYSISANTGTATIGFGTKTGAPSTAGANWFGLPVKINGTADVRSVVWNNNGTMTSINSGTNFGSLSNPGSGTLPQHAFQGTSGVAITDRYIVTIKTQFDNAGKGTMCAL